MALSPENRHFRGTLWRGVLCFLVPFSFLMILFAGLWFWLVLTVSAVAGGLIVVTVAVAFV